MVLKNRQKSSTDFYNDISAFYDEMVGFSSALQRRKDLLKKFITDKTSSAADLGCGTGIDSIALSMNGLRVTGFDISEEMIKKAKSNAKKSRVKIPFIKSGIDKIPVMFYNKFDLVVSLGNSLANLDEKMLIAGVPKMHKLLKQEGLLVVQILNYTRILKDKERIVNINEGGDSIIIRFYDFLPTKLNFNILKINKNDYSKRELNTTSIYPYDKKTFLSLLKKNGFRKIKFYGSLDLKPFDKFTSNDLVIIAEK